MQIDLTNKKFFYEDITYYIFEKILKSNFLFNRKKRLDLGYIKWIYEKTKIYCNGLIFEEDEFFKVIIEKRVDDFSSIFYIDSSISYDIYNFKIIYITLYIPNINPSFDFIKRQLINHIARRVHQLSNDPPFERLKLHDNSEDYILRNDWIDRVKLLELNIGFRAESLYYNICFLKCIKDYLKFIKSDLTLPNKKIYSIKKEDYDIICKDIINCFY